ncbi:hypothetical protein I302_105554 [Kwoniella bestiolae CBS 10118]|uniref:TauD/TfdA-like domain-containing protein n=1 Tax=Kwoniella bestiolae CBS 10118 TaxID=1296100 RepID=A0A1B9FTG7_9TREE|nr:hypothetical protein I302_08837 [Kwoniella bestiolae CBS 10118]OCF22056.1 hypothetical protein I302_08837 [Kwoniella bestiolae CBS 10118]
MTPIAVTQTESIAAPTVQPIKLKGDGPRNPADVARNTLPAPLEYKGSLESYSHFEVTPSIGREFGRDLQLSQLLKAPNSDDLIRDLAVLISRRGVCFFRAQDVNQEEMMQLQKKISVLAGQPKQSNMCIHPVSENVGEMGAKTQLISAEMQRKGGGIMRLHDDVSRWATRAYHSDVSFEKVPSDYSMLKVNVLPESGGDTQWVNCYDILDKISPSMLEYFKGLKAEHNANFFHQEAANHGRSISKTMIRGNPLNVGDDLSARHPLIRTNPVTGWNALYYSYGFGGRIQGVTYDEHVMLREYLTQLCMNNFDCSVRFRWEAGSVAIWDNRSTLHSATFDYTEERSGDRASSIGELPYLSRDGVLKSEALRAEGLKW